MRPRIYVDTSVIGGCFDEEFREDSLRLFELFRVGKARMVFSQIVVAELELAPPRVRQHAYSIPEESREYVDYTDDAAELAQKYIDSGALGIDMFADAQHIATASVHRVTALVSWNFKHIVNLTRIRRYNSVNVLLGYPQLEIRTPRELSSYGQAEDEGV